MKKIKFSRRQREYFFGYLFISIWIIGFFVFTLFPMVQSLYYSFHNVTIANGININKFLGWENYRYALFNYVYFMESIARYALNMLISIPAVIVFSVIIALLLNQKVKFRGIFRTIYFLPVIISSGPVLKKIQIEGGTNIPSLQEGSFIALLQSNLPEFFGEVIALLFSKIVNIMWFTGVPVLILLAGLQKIDRTIYESAAIDGASSWESFWKITLPSLKPLINICIIYSVVAMSMFSNNEVMYIIDSKKVVEFGRSNALAWIYFIVMILIILLLLLFANLRLKRQGRD